MTQILDGRKVAESLLEKVANDVKALKSEGISPKLVVILVGEDPASAIYVRNKEKACEKTGIMSEKMILPSSVSQEELLKKIEAINADASVSGVIVQMPLPSHIDAPKIIRAISPYKEVDGFHAYNMGKMVLSKDYEDMAACTPKGVIEILDYYQINPAGMNAVVIGRSNTVGKPMAMMLLNRDATVTVCHRGTKDMKAYTQTADLIVVAVGKAHVLTADMVKEGAIVIDVGINRLDDGSLAGDADFEGLKDKVKAITPVPGGVGPMTVACLLANTVTAARKNATL